MASIFPPGSGDFFMDCSTLSISYSPTGLASISLTMYSKTGTDFPYSSGGPGFQLIAGGVQFNGFILEQGIAPNSDLSGDWVQWSLSVIATGKKI